METSYISAAPDRIILRTKPCSWGKCIFCGFKEDTSVEPPSVYVQFREYFAAFGVPEYLKVFNSGSFFDFNQMGSWEDKVSYLYDEGVRRLRVESRPEFVPRINSTKMYIEVMIGLETTFIRVAQLINKGFTLAQVVEVARCSPFPIGVYLLAKPCSFYKTDQLALEDLSQNVIQCLELPFFEILVMRTTIRPGSELEKQYKMCEYVPLEKALYEKWKEQFPIKDWRLKYDKS